MTRPASASLYWGGHERGSHSFKHLEDFRFDDNPSVPQVTIAALADGAWIDDRESIIFIGESGTGKTMLATRLAVCACQQGRRVRFTTLAGLANELQEAESAASWAASLVAMRAPSVLSSMSSGISRCPTAPPSSCSRCSQSATTA
jgi:DNA replication protein DnaC